MKALNITQYTGIDGLQYQDVPEPTPGPGQVTIRAEYAGVGYVDALLAEGMAELPLPWAPGIEAAGRIHALGEGVTGLRVGDKVAAPLTLLGSGGGFGQICLAHCISLLSEGDTSMKDCATGVNQMLALCGTLQNLAAQNSRLTPSLAKVCIEACKQCSAACKEHAGHHAECKACYESCLACIKECEKIAA